jgi:TRAP-type C4-dicarboxylate transport system permease small subunit
MFDSHTTALVVLLGGFFTVLGAVYIRAGVRLRNSHPSRGLANIVAGIFAILLLPLIAIAYRYFGLLGGGILVVLMFVVELIRNIQEDRS